MQTVRLEHPELGAVIDAPESAVGHLSMSGWRPAEGEAVPTCPTCGSVWPAFAGPPPEEKTEQAPAESGASASQSPKRRRSTSKGDE